MIHARRVSPLLLAASLLTSPACDKSAAPAPDTKKEAGDAKTDSKTDSKTDADAKTDGDTQAGADTKTAGDAAKAGGDAKAAQLHPDDTQLADKRTKDQLEHGDAAVKAAHDKMVALLAEGRNLVEAGDPKGAIAKYEQLIAIDPHYRPALLELGAAEAKVENWAAAAHHLKLAAKLTNDSDARKAAILDRIGQYEEQLGKHSDAAHYYRESLKLSASPEVQARLDALGDVAPEQEQPPGPPDSVDGLHHHTEPATSPEEVCKTYGDDGLCVPKECNFITAEGDDSWGVFEVGDGTTNCYHPAIRMGEGSWAVYNSAMMDSHGEEVHQGVDRLELSVVEAEGGPYLVIRYADHLYERVWDEELGSDQPLEEDVIDSEGMIVCQRVGDKTRCTEPIITSLAFAIGAQTGKFSAKVEFAKDAVVVSDVVKQGKADATVRTYFFGVLLEPGPHTLPVPF